MSKKIHNVFVSVVLLLVLNLQTCFGNYYCYELSSGKDICFMLDASERNFEESKLFCKNNGGILLEIYNAEIQGLVERFLKRKTTYRGDVWLNLVRNQFDIWVWVGSGNSSSYSNWETSNSVIYGYDIECLDYEDDVDILSDTEFQRRGQFQDNCNNAIMISNYKWRKCRDRQVAATLCCQDNQITYPLTISTKTTTTKPTTLKETQTTNPTTTTTTATTLSSTTTIPSTKDNHANSESLLTGIGIGIGVGIGGMVLIILLSLLIAKFVFHKEIPLPFKSSMSRNSRPHEIGTDITNGVYEQIDEKKLAYRSPYTELILSDPCVFPTHLHPTNGSKDMIQPNSEARLEGLSKADYETSVGKTFGENIYNNDN